MTKIAMALMVLYGVFSCGVCRPLAACPPVAVQSLSVPVTVIPACGVATVQTAVAQPVVMTLVQPTATIVSPVIQVVATPVVVHQQVVRQRVVQPRQVTRSRSVSRVGGLGFF
ncbi:MAG TPA: hypothetical protein VHZ24_20720 [Pirellulales bacterium]|jgi:hypothetical protein|nr:hypothetical protein [Pirellulales bacterium]